MSKHTAGPWRFDEKSGTLFVASGTPTNGTIISNRINSDSMFPPYPAIVEIDDEARANAQLIASSPELLEALKGLLLWTKSTAMHHLKDSDLLPKGLDKWQAIANRAEGV